MAALPDALSYTEAALRRGLATGAAAWLDDFLRRYRYGEVTDGGGATVQTGLRGGLSRGWLMAWQSTGKELAALVAARFPVRGVARHDAAERLTLPPPLPLPEDFRTWLETHMPDERSRLASEGGTSKVPIPRSAAEWLAEHEATVNKWVPREYVDRYLQTRLPPLVGIADRALLEGARDMVAANAERGFGVRETIRSLRRDFPSLAARRLENIARTEGAVLYEHGRLARYMADGLVQGVEYSAVGGKQGDGRTTEICKGLHGSKWRLGSAEVVTPPAHFQCRSTLLPILFNEQPEWTEKQPDPPPLEGFGTVDPALLPPNRTPEELFGGTSLAVSTSPSAMTPEAWAQGLTKKEKEAVGMWGSSGYADLRDAQAGLSDDAETLKQAKDFEAAVARAPKHEGTVYRGLYNVPDETLEALTTAPSMTLDASASATKQRGIAEKFAGWTDKATKHSVLLEIEQRSAADIGAALPVSDEGEVVLPRSAVYDVTGHELIHITVYGEQRPATLIILRERGRP